MNELSLFNSLFDDGDFGFFPAIAKNCSFGVPQVDVKETKDAYALEMDLPGRTEKDVDVDLKDSVLTIASHTEETKEEKSKDKKDGEAQWLIHERRTSSFCRRFTLPQDIDSEKVSATFKNGVLSVMIPRKPLSEPKKIAISVA